MHPFRVGHDYRREELLAFLGSRQQQSGVLWGSQVHGWVICTTGGRHAHHAGYSDRLCSDGTWHYFGQGREGDQDWSAPANRKLLDPDTSILLFTTREPSRLEIQTSNSYKKWYSFAGVFKFLTAEEIIPTTGARCGDKLIRLTFAPLHGEGLKRVAD
jgi:5-methylcytosine-specific restriction enzyme A